MVPEWGEQQKCFAFRNSFDWFSFQWVHNRSLASFLLGCCKPARVKWGASVLSEQIWDDRSSVFILKRIAHRRTCYFTVFIGSHPLIEYQPWQNRYLEGAKGIKEQGSSAVSSASLSSSLSSWTFSNYHHRAILPPPSTPISRHSRIKN